VRSAAEIKLHSNTTTNSLTVIRLGMGREAEAVVDDGDCLKARPVKDRPRID
jgi:hypothetical protein